MSDLRQISQMNRFNGKGSKRVKEVTSVNTYLYGPQCFILWLGKSQET